MKISTLIATATTAAVLGTAGVSIAGASTSSSSPKPAASASTAGSAQLSRAGRRALVQRFGRQAFLLAAKTIGVKPADLLKELRDGKSIADVATEHGVQPQTVIDAIVKAADAKIDASKLTDTQKQRLEARVPTAAANFVNNPHPHAGKGVELRRAIVRDGVKLAAKTINITPQQLVSELRAGKTIAQVATEHGVQPQTVIDALVKAADAKIEASKLTAAQKQKLEARVPTAIANLVNNWHPKSK